MDMSDESTDMSVCSTDTSDSGMDTDTGGSHMGTRTSYIGPQYGPLGAPTVAPEPADNAPQLGVYRPNYGKDRLTKSLLNNLRRSRAELKRIYKNENDNCLEAQRQNNEHEVLRILNTWQHAVRKYILRLTQYGRKVGTMSSSEARSLHDTYKLGKMGVDSMTLEHKKFLLELYPEELRAVADRSEYITENHGRRPPGEVEPQTKKKRASAPRRANTGAGKSVRFGNYGKHGKHGKHGNSGTSNTANSSTANSSTANSSTANPSTANPSTANPSTANFGLQPANDSYNATYGNTGTTNSGGAQPAAATRGNASAASFGTRARGTSFSSQAPGTSSSTPAPGINFSTQPAAPGTAFTFTANRGGQHVPTGPANTGNTNQGRQHGGYSNGGRNSGQRSVDHSGCPNSQRSINAPPQQSSSSSSSSNRQHGNAAQQSGSSAPQHSTSAP